jgi:F420-0:gamma-glutamyl ligase
VVLIRGLPVTETEATAADLIRDAREDLFR